jgi:hypothetical protein
MRRVNSLHITHPDFVKVLESVIGKKRITPDEIEQVFKKASKLQITSRSIDVKAYKNNKLSNVALAKKTDGELFSHLLKVIRQSHKHRGVRMYNEGDPEWATIKKLSSEANAFCENNSLERVDGYKKYIQTAMPLMKSFILPRMLGLSSVIADTYEALEEIRLDDNKDLTARVYQRYLQVINEKTSIIPNYSKEPLQYKYFIECAQMCKQLRVEPLDFIKAQFEYLPSVPYPSQLVGEKARNRVSRYLYDVASNKIQKPQDDPVLVIDFSKIKKSR